MAITYNKQCLACNSSNLTESLNLGLQPLANSYVLNDYEPEDLFDLGVNLCLDCYHLQLSISVDPELIYKNYLYVSGTTNAMKNYAHWFANYIKEKQQNARSILDIGCNDGTQLNYFKSLGFETYGIDPAENLFPSSSANHNIFLDFFNDLAVKRIDKKFDILTAQNVMAHNPNPLAFLNNCSNLMHDDSILYIQTSQSNMIINNEFDTIYHEHINFFNVQSMKRLSDRSNLNLIDVVKTPIHGISYIFVFSKTKRADYNIKNIMDLEKSLGLYDSKTYNNWMQNVKNNTKELTNQLLNYRDQGFKLVGYGAAAKGNTLLNFIKVKLDYILDDNTLKHNYFTPGMHIPIFSPEILRNEKLNEKILYIPLAWNFFEEIVGKIKNIRSNTNDKFCRYFPMVKVYDFL